MESGEAAGIIDGDNQNGNQNNENQEAQASGDRQEVTDPPSNIPTRSRSNSPPNSIADEPQEKSSRLRITKNPNSWNSSNAFINFLADFRQSYRGGPDAPKGEMFRLAGEYWRQMTEEEKKPYIDAAESMKIQKNSEPSTSKRKRGVSKAAVRKRKSKAAKKPKVVKPISDSEESDSEDSTKTMDSDNESVDTNAS